MRRISWIIAVIFCSIISFYIVVYRDPYFHAKDFLYSERVKVDIREVNVGRGLVYFFTEDFKKTYRIDDVIYCLGDDEKRFSRTTYLKCTLFKDSMSADILLIYPSDSVEIKLKVSNDSTLYSDDQSCLN